MLNFFRFTAVFVPVLFAVTVTSCARASWKRSVISSEGSVATFRERRFDENGKEVYLGYSHPINLSPDQLSRVLGALSYTKDELLWETTEKLIEPELLENLSRQVSKALEDLSPDERLRFLTIHEEGNLFLNRHVGSSAVIFAPNDTEVTIAFDLAGDTLMTGDGDPKRVRFHHDPMQLTDPRFQLRGLEALLAPRDSSKPATPSNQFTFETRNIASLPAAPTPSATDIDTKAPDDPPKTSSQVKPPNPAQPADTPPANTSDPTFGFAYKGFSVVSYGGTYYGLAASEGKFDPEKLKAGSYKTLFERGSVDEVITTIDAIVESVKDR